MSQWPRGGSEGCGEVAEARRAALEGAPTAASIAFHWHHSCATEEVAQWRRALKASMVAPSAESMSFSRSICFESCRWKNNINKLCCLLNTPLELGLPQLCVWVSLKRVQCLCSPQNCLQGCFRGARNALPVAP